MQFDFINKPFAYVMQFFDSFLGNYGLSLLLFAILIKLIFIPIGIKQQKNQIKQASLRPKEEIIKKKYSGRTDKATQQKQQQEIIELYQKENYSPAGGCLPLILQLVIIMSLYQIIRQPLTYICNVSSEQIIEWGTQFKDVLGIKGDNVVFNAVDQLKLIGILPDAVKATLSNLPNFNFLGINLTVTPITMFDSFTKGNGRFLSVVIYSIVPVVCFVLQLITMRLTRKFTYQSPNQGNMDATMKTMDLAMPLMSLVFCFTFSTAIGLYWIYQNLLSFAQTVILAKAMPVPKFTEEDIKRIEKEMKAKGYDTKRSELPKVRSLHHIDDDDYESLPEANGNDNTARAPLLNGDEIKIKNDGDKKNK